MEIQNIMTEITRKMAEAEEMVIKDVLRNLLKREPTIDDAKDIQILKIEGCFDWYFLAYKNLKLGKVTRNYDLEGGKIGVRFDSCEMKDFLEPATTNNGTKLNF